MTPVKDEKTGKWFIQFWYKDSFGENKKLPDEDFLLNERLWNGI